MKEAPALCSNCQSSLEKQAKYCAQCGQSTKEVNGSIWSLLAEAAEELFDVEARHVQTFKVLLLKPGQLTLDFFAGKRIRYILPMRLFLFISVMSLFLQNLESQKNLANVEKVISKQMGRGRPVNLNLGYATLTLSAEEMQMLHLLHDQQIDSLVKAKGHGHDKIIKAVVKKVPVLSTKGGMMAMSNMFQQLFSYAQFLLMPFFALGLMLLFNKPKRLYIQHLVHAIHIHTILFLTLGLSAFGSWAFSLLEAGALQALTPVYAILSLKRVYQKSWLSTLLRLFACLLLYATLLVPLVVALAIVSLLMS